MYLLKITAGAAAQVETVLAPIAKSETLLLLSVAEVRRKFDDMLASIVGSFWVLLAIGFLVAAFGIANTLTMNVLEQTREIGLVRTVGMMRRQIRKMIVVQALVVGGIGFITGTVAGVIMAYVMSLCAEPLLGHAVQFVLHPWLVIFAALATLLVTFVAALSPAERAARLNLLTALAYE